MKGGRERRTSRERLSWTGRRPRRPRLGRAAAGRIAGRPNGSAWRALCKNKSPPRRVSVCLREKQETVKVVPSRRNDDGSNLALGERTLVLDPLDEPIHDRENERERLSTSGNGLDDDVLVLDEERDRRGLDGGHPVVVEVVESGLNERRQRGVQGRESGSVGGDRHGERFQTVRMKVEQLGLRVLEGVLRFGGKASWAAANLESSRAESTDPSPARSQQRPQTPQAPSY